MTSWEKSLHVLASATAAAAAQKMTRTLARASPRLPPLAASSPSFGATNEAERREFTLFFFRL